MRKHAKKNRQVTSVRFASVCEPAPAISGVAAAASASAAFRAHTKITSFLFFGSPFVFTLLFAVSSTARAIFYFLSSRYFLYHIPSPVCCCSLGFGGDFCKKKKKNAHALFLPVVKHIFSKIPHIASNCGTRISNPLRSLGVSFFCSLWEMRFSSLLQTNGLLSTSFRY